MNNRELFHATMSNNNGSELLHMEQGFNVPYKTWYTEGLPNHVQTMNSFNTLSEKENLYDYMNVSGFLFCKFEEFCLPEFKHTVLEKNSDSIKYIDKKGNTLMRISDSKLNRRDDGTRIGSPPHEIDFAIKTLNDYEENRYRYVGSYSKRYNNQWLEKNAETYRNQQDYVSALFIHGPFAYLRELLGTENAMIVPYTDPVMTRMILKDHLETSMASTEQIIKECKPDATFIWEDCCGSSGPFISPFLFDDQFAWWYKQWKDFTLSMGVYWTVLDTDGDPSPLVKKWYENGIDCMLPWEVNGINMLKFADEYPHYKMMGGIYKHMFEPNDPSQVGRFKTNNVYEAIDNELDRVMKPMVKRGGYFPSLDHYAHWAVSFDAYKYYSDKLLDFGKSNIVTRKF